MKTAENKLREHLEYLLHDTDIPKHKIIFLHAGIRSLKVKFDIDYATITRVILELLNKELSPLTILVPTYTNASFRYTGIYHSTFSRSEVGRFSEEVRLSHTVYRTPDPIYSLADTSDYLQNIITDIDFTTTYGDGSLFDYLNEKDYVIINLGLEEFYCTQIHAAEYKAKVPYRYVRSAFGVVYYDPLKYQKLEYKSFLLNSTSIGVTYPVWDRHFIEESLISFGVLQRRIENGTRLLWCTSQHLTSKLTETLIAKPDFLLKKERILTQ
ncbi:MAG: AAC(3) family N-acetyltransferase [Fluviicola sp.]|nr:AAC(3) family N-acetyltransferase [Fluviicola sp.]